MEVDHISLVTTPIWLRQGDKIVSQGTGFYFLIKLGENQLLFLVTNHHVLTGSSPIEDKAPIGDNIIFQFHKSETETSKIRTKGLPLYTRSGRALWVSSDAYPEADFAIIPIPANYSQGYKVFCLSEEWATQRMKTRPATSVSLVGYPYGYYDTTNALPVWKSGTLASEPSIDFEGKPLVLVDVSAFPGMSGSPVFAVSNGMFEDVKGKSVSPGVVRQFIGIYASMIMRNESKYLEEIVHDTKLGINDCKSLQIGHVWKSDIIIDAINSIDIQKYEAEILKDLG